MAYDMQEIRLTLECRFLFPNFPLYWYCECTPTCGTFPTASHLPNREFEWAPKMTILYSSKPHMYRKLLSQQRASPSSQHHHSFRLDK